MSVSVAMSGPWRRGSLIARQCTMCRGFPTLALQQARRGCVMTARRRAICARTCIGRVGTADRFAFLRDRGRHPSCPPVCRGVQPFSQEAVMKRSIGIFVAAFAIVGAGRVLAQDAPGPGTL